MAFNQILFAIAGIGMVLFGVGMILWRVFVNRSYRRDRESLDVAAGRVIDLEFDTHDESLVVPVDVRRVTAEFCDLSGNTHLIVQELDLNGTIFEAGDVVDIVYDERSPVGTAKIAEGRGVVTAQDERARLDMRVGILAGVGLAIVGSALVVFAGFGM